MVRWFDPTQLAGTAVQVVVSALFGAYSDKREIQAALAPDAQPHRDYAQENPDGVWFDYVADLGDGFESTYTIAHLLGRPSLELGWEGQSWDTQRGRILVMGGDQVYPTATLTEYQNRLLGPYQAALPQVVDLPPHLYAIPGNHDWYDGLTNFLRIFCRRQWIGAWLTGQQRSYFALELPKRWWLWGIDIQFDTYIDEPQLAYFAAAKTLLKEGDRLILVTGKPSWTKSMKPRPDPSYSNLAYFEDEMLKDTKATLAVVVSGDLHHYARYEDASGNRHRITSGGGGAYLFPTHHLRPGIELQEGRKGNEQTIAYALRARYPPAKVSRGLRWKAAWRLPIVNHRLLRVLAPVYLAAALLLHVPVRRSVGRPDDVAFSDIGRLAWDAVTSLWFFFALTVLAGLFVLFAAPKGLFQRAVLGLSHAVPHLALVCVFVPSSAWALSLTGNLDEHALPVATLAALLATLFGAWILGFYLSVCDRIYQSFPEHFDGLVRHANEAFSCQGIQDWKSFLRFHIDRDGRLTIFPIGVERVARKQDLELDPEGGEESPYYKLPEAVRPRLIEEPVQVPKAD
jgi:hypothetical protein